MNRLFAAIQKVNVWNKVLKGLIPVLLCLAAIATLPEQNGTAWYIEKTIEKEEKESGKTEQADTEEEYSYDSSFKKSKRKVVKIFSDSFITAFNYTFASFSCLNDTEKNAVLPNQGKSCAFYILCHQLVFYEG